MIDIARSEQPLPYSRLIEEQARQRAQQIMDIQISSATEEAQDLICRLLNPLSDEEMLATNLAIQYLRPPESTDALAAIWHDERKKIIMAISRRCSPYYVPKLEPSREPKVPGGELPTTPFSHFPVTDDDIRSSKMEPSAADGQTVEAA